MNNFFFFRNSRICIFLEEGGILVLTSVNLEKKGLFFMSSVLWWKRGFIWTDKSVFNHKKGGSFWTEMSVLYRKKRGGFELKSQSFAAKYGVIFKLENKDGYHFFQWVKEPGPIPRWLTSLSGTIPTQLTTLSAIHPPND